MLTGLRRSGKSTVLKMVVEELTKQGIEQQRIISMNFESFAFAPYTTSMALYQYISERIGSDAQHYVLLDEIQLVEEWEKAVNALIVDFNVDLYLTGSNSNLLSSELATYLGGRYVEIPIYTLSYGEYLDFRTQYGSVKEEYNDDPFLHYLQFGGFPIIHTLPYDMETAHRVVRDIYSSVILRHTVQRHGIRDIELLERVIGYAFDNIGNTFSGKNVADYFKSQQRRLDINTVYNYLNALEGAFILYRVPRYDIKGKEILKTQEKYFAGDISLIYANMGYRHRMIAGLLENIVFLELKRRGFRVYVGKLEQTEVDFVAERQNQRFYIQVAYKLENEQTVRREYGPLLAIRDQYPKMVVSMDTLWNDNVEGVKHSYITDFLTSDILL